MRTHCGCSWGRSSFVRMKILPLQSHFPPQTIRCCRHRWPWTTCTTRDTGSRSEEHTSELQSRQYLVCRLLLEKKNTRPHLGERRHHLQREAGRRAAHDVAEAAAARA